MKVIELIKALESSAAFDEVMLIKVDAEGRQLPDELTLERVVRYDQSRTAHVELEVRDEGIR